MTPSSAFEARRLVVADGLTLAARDYAGGSRTPVVCLHGLTRNSRDFEALAPRIASTGRRVIVPDVRGRGLSDRDPEPQRYTPLTYAQDMLAWLDHLGVERAAFVGTSMGGLITMVLAHLAPGRVAAAVLNDIGPEIDPAGLQRINRSVGLSRGPFEFWTQAALSVRVVNLHAFPDRARDLRFWHDFALRCCRRGDDGLIRYDYDPAISANVGAGAAVPVDLWPLFAGLAAIPTLVVRGALSDLLSAETVAAMLATKPDLVTCEVAGVGHAPMLDEPEAGAALAAFLEAVP